MKNQQLLPKKQQRHVCLNQISGISMKKILIPVMLGLLCAPLQAKTSLHESVKQLGYSELFIEEGLPFIEGKTSDLADVKSKSPEVAASHNLSYERPLSSADDLLHPRVFHKGESLQMIPLLTKLHKQNPGSDKITRKLAVTCLRNGQPREALHWYIATYQRDRADYESLWNSAAIAYRLNDMDKAHSFLQEYSKVDPHSAWGRMAREFLAGKFSGTNLAQGFQKGYGRTSSAVGTDPEAAQLRKRRIAEGKINPISDGTGTQGVMVIEGQRTTFNQFMENSEQTDTKKSKSETLKGKKRTAKKAPQGPKSSLGKAKIAEKAP